MHASLPLHADVSSTVTDYGMILLDERSSRYFHLNHTAAAIVQSLGDGHDVDCTVAAITRRFGIDETQVRRDLDALLAGLRDAGLMPS